MENSAPDELSKEDMRGRQEHITSPTPEEKAGPAREARSPVFLLQAPDPLQPRIYSIQLLQESLGAYSGSHRREQIPPRPEVPSTAPSPPNQACSSVVGCLFVV